jgi:hypothetical protein
MGSRIRKFFKAPKRLRIKGLKRRKIEAKIVSIESPEPLIGYKKANAEYPDIYYDPRTLKY